MPLKSYSGLFKLTLILIVIFINFNQSICHGHHEHSDEPPAMKWSRAANEKHQQNLNSHGNL